MINSVQTVQRHVLPAAPLRTCFPPPPARYVAPAPAISPSLVAAAFYAELLQRRRTAFGLQTASLADGRPTPPAPLSAVVPSALFQPATSSFRCPSLGLSSQRHPVVPAVLDDAEDDDVDDDASTTSPTVIDSSSTLRKLLSVNTNRYHPYEKTA